MSKVVVHRNAAKYLQRLPEETRERVKKMLEQLQQEPLQNPGVKHMVGDWLDIIGYEREI